MSRHLPAQRDPLTRGGGQIAAGADVLAIATLDAAVDSFLDYGRSLQVLQMAIEIVSEHDSRRENIFRIGEALQLPHQGGKFSAPFALNVGRDVAPGAVFS